MGKGRSFFAKATSLGGKQALLVLASLLLASLLVDLSRFHLYEHGDSLVPVLVSLERYTPLYWDQERYGMLIPLLALPVRDPLLNLLLERGLLVFAGLSSVVLLARYVLEREEAFPTGLACAASLLLFFRASWLFEYLGDQPYGLGLALALLGLLLSRSSSLPHWPRRILAALLSLVSGWVNAGAALFLLPLVVARAARERICGGEGAPAHGGLGQDLFQVLLGLASGEACIVLYPIVTGFRLRLLLGPSPPEEWGRALKTLMTNGLEDAGPYYLPLVLSSVLLGLALALVLWGFREGAKNLARETIRALPFLVAALLCALFTASLRWVKDNGYNGRYLAQPVLLVFVAGLAFFLRPLLGGKRVRGLLFALLLVLLPVSASLALGRPSLSLVRKDLDRKLGKWTEDVLSAKCDLVTGDYWSVWPAVFHAALVAKERGERPPYGLTHRSNPTARFWKGRPKEELRICAVLGAEEEAERWLKAFHLWPVRVVETRRTVSVEIPLGPSLGSGSG